jgi:aquaporin Z
MEMNLRSYGAELLGTFLFMAIGYGSVVAFGAGDVAGLLVVPFSFGLGLLAAIFAFGHISGGHFNPAVTIAMVLDKRLPAVDGVGYIASQMIGAITAAILILVVAGQAGVASGITRPGGGVSDTGALLYEIILTAGFLVVILASTRRAPALAALAIPLTLVGIHFASATLTGASVNPARSIGSAVVGGDVGALWIYLAGPSIGGVAGWLVWRLTDGGAPAPAPVATAAPVEAPA